MQNVQQKLQQQLWDIAQAATFLNINPGTLYHWVSQKRVPCVRLGSRCLRFDAERLKQWAAEHGCGETARRTATLQERPHH
jgi:excisionase family DNA binding protein